jgi:3-hydroxybutyrate dehydrogenase/3-oxoacyl-[acyl-carrier protein] reductase
VSDTDQMREVGPAAAEGLSHEVWLSRYATDAATQRVTKVEEIAAVAALLTTDAGAGITGSLISVDGGTASW